VAAMMEVFCGALGPGDHGHTMGRRQSDSPRNVS
jgi:hypothetical protein